MRNINNFAKIIKFGLLIGSFFINSRLEAENLKRCPENFPKIGVQVTNYSKGVRAIITVRKGLKDPLNNLSLQEYVALLKLKAAEKYQEYFYGSSITSTPTKYGGKRYTKKIHASLYQKKISMVSMREIDTCVKKDAIFFSAEWTSESIESAKKVIQLQKAMEELKALKKEDPKFKLKDLYNKYPKIFSAEDPKIIMEAINYWKKNRKL